MDTIRTFLASSPAGVMSQPLVLTARRKLSHRPGNSKSLKVI